MAVTASVAVAGLGYSTYEQHKAQKEMRKEQKELKKTERAVQAEQAARSRRRQVAQMLVARANIENTAAASGMSTSSAALTGAQGVTAQAGGNIAQINSAVSNANRISKNQEDVALAGQVSPWATLAGSVGGQVAGGVAAAGGQKVGASLFGP